MVQLLVLRGADVEALGPGQEHLSVTDERVFVAMDNVQERP